MIKYCNMSCIVVLYSEYVLFISAHFYVLCIQNTVKALILKYIEQYALITFILTNF
jgi:hypothetical protein